MTVELITVKQVLASYGVDPETIMDAPVGTTYTTEDAEIKTTATLGTDGLLNMSISVYRFR